MQPVELFVLITVEVVVMQDTFRYIPQHFKEFVTANMIKMSKSGFYINKVVLLKKPSGSFPIYLNLRC